MRISLNINNTQMRKLRQKFGQLRSLRWLEKPIKQSMWYMIDSIQKNFKAEGRPNKWVEWHPKYREFRVRMGYPLTKLRLAGKVNPQRGVGRSRQGRTYALQLSRSLSVGKKKSDGWVIGTNLDYAAIHQFGGVTGKYGQSTIPRRMYLMFHAQDITVISSLFNAHIQKLLVA